MTFLRVISQAVALAPFSQNSNGMRLRRLGPGTAHAHEAAGLVLLEQDFAAENSDFFLCQNAGDGLNRSPPTGRSIISPHLRPLSHGQLSNLAGPVLETAGDARGSFNRASVDHGRGVSMNLGAARNFARGKSLKGWVAVVGDGGFAMLMAELSTAVRTICPSRSFF